MTAGHSQLSDWRMDCKFVAKLAEDMVVKLYWDVRVHETLNSDEWVWSKRSNHAYKPFYDDLILQF